MNTTMTKAALLVLITLLISAGCGETVPDENEEDTSNETGNNDDEDSDADSSDADSSDADSNDEGETDEDTPDIDCSPYATDYYPLGVGWFWEYNESFENETITTKLEYTVSKEEEHTFPYLDDPKTRTVFIVENTFFDSNNEKRIQYIEDDGTRPMRLKHEIFTWNDETGKTENTKQRDYAPGFLRFDREKMLIPSGSWSEEVIRHTDTMDETDISHQIVNYEFEVIGTDESTTVPAGTFSCTHVRRTSSIDAEIKDYWYAAGIGKVKEVSQTEDGTKIEELNDCSCCD